MKLWSKRAFVKCFVVLDIQARKLEHGIWGVINILNTAANSLL